MTGIQQPQSAPAVDSAAETSLLDALMQQTRMSPGDDGYAIARRGVAAFITGLVSPAHTGGRIDKGLVDAMITTIDQALSRQLDAVLHHAAFQRIEGAWRCLKLLVDRTDFRENIRIHLLDVAKDRLREDFEDAPEIARSGLYKIVYSGEYGQFGGEPYGAMIADYEFGPSPQDIALLQKVASVATMAHAPFIAAAAPAFFGIDSYERLAGLNDIAAILDGPQYAKWQAFRHSEDSRGVALTCPRFLLRLPYGPDTRPVKAFDYREQVAGRHDDHLWGNTAFAFATRLTESFARFRWCPNIIGPRSGGAVDDLPLHRFPSLGAVATTIPTEVLVSERRECELAEEGFIALAMRKGSDSAAFFSANSCQRPRTLGRSAEDRAVELNHRLGTQLPYLFIINRLAHYLKVLQREQIGSWKGRADLEDELNRWIGRYVVDSDNVDPDVRSRKPLRMAAVTVEDVPGNAGWYQVSVKARPHFKYLGASFTLSLVGRIEKA